ncbi:hypothetical protein TNCV_1917181 [Trichonephila clavipes]|uniref:Uncharacterized protein n=1 Tax=Trichonephila clavipes TaxID=2585209 RepID=A0A8X7BBS9_TRICX|nr:hypothetical protein TNCV_1917181 [Trichonephila clavipes]
MIPLTNSFYGYLHFLQILEKHYTFVVVHRIPRKQSLDLKDDDFLTEIISKKEIDQAMEEPDRMDINYGIESKFHNSDEHETFQLKVKFSNAT